MVGTTTIGSLAAESLSPAGYRALTLAHSRAAKVRKAARVANFNGWTTAVLATLSAPFALWGGVGLVMFAGLAIVAFNELWGRRRLLAFDPTASTILGCNQLGLLLLISGYSLWAIWNGADEARSLTAEIQGSAELTDALGSLNVEGLYKQISLAFYGSIIAGSVLMQGLTAWYYFSRRKHIEACVSETPTWALDVERAMASG